MEKMICTYEYDDGDGGRTMSGKKGLNGWMAYIMGFVWT